MVKNSGKLNLDWFVNYLELFIIYYYPLFRFADRENSTWDNAHVFLNRLGNFFLSSSDLSIVCITKLSALAYNPHRSTN